MTNSSTKLLRVGVVTGSHGLRGELKLRGEDPDFSVLLEHDELFIQPTGGVPLAGKILRRSSVRGNLVVRLHGFDDVEAVKGLIGAAVLIDLNRLPTLPQGAYYWHQLRGLRAIDKQDGDLGTLSQLFTTAAHDIYVVNGRYGEVLIPAVPHFIAKIDLAAGEILFDLPEGLVTKPDDL
jgi:16S rRNA processing protein RimM